jgi:hypothetical protein
MVGVWIMSILGQSTPGQNISEKSIELSPTKLCTTLYAKKRVPEELACKF